MSRPWTSHTAPESWKRPFGRAARSTAKQAGSWWCEPMTREEFSAKQRQEQARMVPAGAWDLQESESCARLPVKSMGHKM